MALVRELPRRAAVRCNVREIATASRPQSRGLSPDGRASDQATHVRRARCDENLSVIQQAAIVAHLNIWAGQDAVRSGRDVQHRWDSAQLVAARSAAKQNHRAVTWPHARMVACTRVP